MKQKINWSLPWNIIFMEITSLSLPILNLC